MILIADADLMSSSISARMNYAYDAESWLLPSIDAPRRSQRCVDPRQRIAHPVKHALPVATP